MIRILALLVLTSCMAAQEELSMTVSTITVSDAYGGYEVTDANGYTYLLSDGYNNSFQMPGRYVLRNVRRPTGEIIIGNGTSDYQLQATTSMDLAVTPRIWYDYQGKGVSSERLSEHVEITTTLFELTYTVLYFYPDNEDPEHSKAIAAVEHTHTIGTDWYQHKVKRVALSHYCLWIEYFGVVPVFNPVESIQLHRDTYTIGVIPAIVNGLPDVFDLGSVGNLGPSDLSDYANVGEVEGYTLVLPSDVITVDFLGEMELQIGDHAGIRAGQVVPYGLVHTGMQEVNAGDTEAQAWVVEIRERP